MRIEVNDYHFNCGKAPTEISFIQWLRLKLRGEVKVFDAMKAGWTEPLPFFVFKCQSCGEYALDYPHGYRGRLDCSVCNEAATIFAAVQAVFEPELEAQH